MWCVVQNGVFIMKAQISLAGLRAICPLASNPIWLAHAGFSGVSL
jgi:hypothetical protein